MKDAVSQQNRCREVCFHFGVQSQLSVRTIVCFALLCFVSIICVLSFQEINLYVSTQCQTSELPFLISDSVVHSLTNPSCNQLVNSSCIQLALLTNRDNLVNMGWGGERNITVPCRRWRHGKVWSPARYGSGVRGLQRPGSLGDPWPRVS